MPKQNLLPAIYNHVIIYIYIQIERHAIDFRHKFSINCLALVMILVNLKLESTRYYKEIEYEDTFRVNGDFEA